ncbi:MAG: TatD family hydrolase [Chitinophagales bacterium]|nr:TatD family hydrolase [Chitinophagales bacterium]
MIIDTHAHTYLKDFNDDLDQVVERAREIGVEKVLLPNIDTATIDDMFSLQDSYPDFFIPMLGLHPCSVKKDYKAQLDVIYEKISGNEICAIGEIGLDYYWDTSFSKQQKDAYNTQIKWAKELELPIVIHSRDSIDDCIKAVSDSKDERLRGVFHCFGGTVVHAEEIIKNEFLMGIGGVVTFKNGGLDKVLPDIPLESLVVETDSPYLSPVPYRGKRNESSYLVYVVKKIAEIYGIEESKVEEITTRNAIDLFSLSNMNVKR